jgi:hypothetical protein
MMMSAAFIAIGISLAIHSTGQGDAQQTVPFYYPYQMRYVNGSARFILPPGPGDGWGFPNGARDGYGWVDYGTRLPLAADRTAEYYFPRYHSVPPEQMFFPTYYNPFETRGQRYLPYVANGGAHPAGGPPMGPADLPVSPYAAIPGNRPLVTVPRLNGRFDAPPTASGGTGLTP